MGSSIVAESGGQTDAVFELVDQIAEKMAPS